MGSVYILLYLISIVLGSYSILQYVIKYYMQFLNQIMDINNFIEPIKAREFLQLIT